MQRRHSNKSPYKQRRDDAGNALLSRPSSDVCSNVSLLSKLEHRRHRLPYKQEREEKCPDNNNDLDANRKQNHTAPTRDERVGPLPLLDVNRASSQSSYGHRSISAPKSRIWDRDLNRNYDQEEQTGERTPSPLPRNTIQKQRGLSPLKTPSVGEINEIVTNLKLCRAPVIGAPNIESTESIAPGDIFFSRDHTSPVMRHNVLPKGMSLAPPISTQFLEQITLETPI